MASTQAASSAPTTARPIWPDIPAADSRCGPPQRDRLPETGKPITVRLQPAQPFVVGRIPATTWRNTPVADLGWKLRFLGLAWMRPVAVRAYNDGRSDVLAELIAQTVAFHRENPDPHNVKHGWDEGTAMRRLETANCLYALTRAPALIPGMVADAAVQLDQRYYGPPYRPVHNHGLMACIQLFRAADLLHRPYWKKVALLRMSREAPKAFSPMGTSMEQASGYQQFNASQWDKAADLLAGSPGSAGVVAKIRDTVDKAYRMLAWMTQPDGTIAQYGDSDELKGRPMDLGEARSVRDDKAGLIAGRWSWTDPQTAHYTVRYGPARRAHGHRDQAGAVTFATQGVRVLVGPGRYSYNRDDPFWIYQMTPQATNVAVPSPGFVTQAPADVAVSTFAPLRHEITVQDKIYQDPHTRTIAVDPAAMTVSDLFHNATEWRQSWHLDPKWTLLSHSPTRLTFRHPAGRILTVTTTGRVEAVQHGAIGNAAAGWHFPKEGVKQPAYQITVRNDGPECSTRFEVTSASGPRSHYSADGMSLVRLPA
ncbi:heparinase II/III family protein [Actinoplanes sp. NBRC 103695]|uniref:heparinase II/III family protein n=1 Tax=Actinoplanes sp. NBRC 103695 TaxID=3032202 RepID=UPI002552FF65|nr:heparinase II/III family protein [Actinoplanes sp. NBRC 103695]